MQIGRINFGPSYLSSTLGFDSLFNDVNEFLETGLSKSSGFPPYNIKKENNDYTVEIAAAGFSEDELDISLENGYLTIVGERKEKEVKNFIYHGIANRSFKRVFRIADNVLINGAEFVNGILKIYLESVVPEHQRPRKILIGSVEKPQLLVEESK